MPVYNVLVREVHVSYRRVEAESAEEALEKVGSGEDEGEETILEYSHTQDSDCWTVDTEDGVEVIGQYRKKKTITCSVCGKDASKETAHFHQGSHIGDECCWDERLRTTE